MDIEREAAIEFIRTGYDPADWIAVFLKSYATGWIAQRVGPVSLVVSARFQDWLRRANDVSANVYISVNAVRAGQLTRTRRTVAEVRHVFLDADRGADAVLATIERRPDLSEPAYVVHSSPGRTHVMWRVAHVSVTAVERVQRYLACELHTDPAATSASQLTRLPGFFNHKYATPPLVTVDYRCWGRVYAESDFPFVEASRGVRSTVAPAASAGSRMIRRAQSYLRAVPPAIAGRHGDVHTFRVCCRLVRGFALSDSEALHALSEWNGRCDPPWSERELRQKLGSARRNGREPVGGLLHDHHQTAAGLT